MSDLRSEIVNKVLNAWESPTPALVADKSITRNIFEFIKNNPSCTINDVVDGTGVELGRASATTLALYNRGKLDRKPYPNPDPNGKRHNVFVYWTAVDEFTEQTKARKPKTKSKKEKLSQAKRIEQDILAPLNERLRPMPRMKQFADEFNPEMFVQDLSLKQARAVYEVLKGYFSG